MPFESKLMVDEAGYLDEKEIRKILASCNENEYVLILTLWKTGARISEILGNVERKKRVDPLTKRRINFEKQAVVIRNLKQKQKEWKTVYVDDEFCEFMKKYTENMKPNEPVFKFSRFTAFRRIRKVCKKAGFEIIGTKQAHPHHFRHSFAMQGINNDVKLPFLQKQLGHSSLAATGFYTTIKEKDMKRELKKMWKT